MERNIAYKNTIDVASQEFDYSTTDPSTVKAVTAFA